MEISAISVGERNEFESEIMTLDGMQGEFQGRFEQSGDKIRACPKPIIFAQMISCLVATCNVEKMKVMCF